MTSSNSIPTNEKETLNYIDDSTDQLDEQRLSGLQEEQNTQLIKDEVLKREKMRLEAKHGNSHPEVKKAESRIEYNKEMFTGLNKEIDKASTKTDPLPDNAWRVNGRVFDQNNNAIKGVTVFLSDQNKRWIEMLGNSCSNETGYYALTADDKILDKIENGQPLFLTVSDKNKKIIYYASSAIFATKGVIKHEDIYLNDDDCVLPPTNPTTNPETPSPTPNNPAVKPLTPDGWQVKGKVTDEYDKGLKGLTVSLYDQDLFFDDVLGTTLTNESGNFEIIYRTEAFKFLFEKKPDIYLKVLDSKGKKLYTSENKIRPNAGRVEEFVIVIPSNKK